MEAVFQNLNSRLCICNLGVLDKLDDSGTILEMLQFTSIFETHPRRLELLLALVPIGFYN